MRKRYSLTSNNGENMDYQKVIELVKEASKIIFDKDLKNSVAMKGEADFVTAVDLAISQFIKEGLTALTPDIGFMSEEEDNEITVKRWILDPIDGTTNLIYGFNFSSISLAYFDGEKIDFGVIYNPFNKDLFVAKRGEGVYLNGEKLPIAKDRNLKECIVEFGAGATKKQFIDESFVLGKEIFRNCLDIRRNCSSALAIAYVASGKLNGYFERNIKPWDYAAATLMLEECGAICSDWDGNPIQFEKPSSFVCGTPKLYEFLLKTIKEQTGNK